MAQYDMAPEYNTDPSLVGISYDSESHLSDCGVSGGQWSILGRNMAECDQTLFTIQKYTDTPYYVQQ